MDFFERLLQIRTNKKLLQKDISAAINISVRQYQRYEKNEQEPTLSVLIALAKYFNVSLDYLAGLSDTQTRQP